MNAWTDLVGQERAVAELRKAATDPTSMTHAWLITGPPGSGRSVAALAFAAALQCANRIAPGCGECPSCITVRAGTHPDVTRVTTEKVLITIDETRELVNLAARTPATGRWRVVIVEDADRMVERTGNVLLKAVEEPPPRTVWLLCAPTGRDVLATIRSRCREVTLKVPAAEAVAELLQRRDGVDPQVALLAARAAQSHIGRARRLALDPGAALRRQQVLDLAANLTDVPSAVLGAARLGELAKAEASAATEERNATERADLLRVLGVGEGEAAPAKLRGQLREQAEEQKRRARRAERDVLDQALLDLLSLYRDVLVAQLSAEVPTINTSYSEVPRLAAASTPQATLRNLEAISLARNRLAQNVAPALALEALLVSLRPVVAPAARLTPELPARTPIFD